MKKVLWIPSEDRLNLEHLLVQGSGSRKEQNAHNLRRGFSGVAERAKEVVWGKGSQTVEERRR
jgi:hypothetical protein